MTILKIKVHTEGHWEKAFAKNKVLAKQFLLRSGSVVKNLAQQSLHEGNKSGKLVKRYKPKRTHRQSAPGEAPASDEGYLAGQISVEMHTDGLGVSIASGAEYSAALEFGTKDMKARPFLVPALEESIPEVRRLFHIIFKDVGSK